MHPNDAVGIELPEDPRFLDEPPAHVCVIAPVVREDLDGDLGPEQLIAAPVHGRERAAAQRGVDPVATDPIRHRRAPPLILCSRAANA